MIHADRFEEQLGHLKDLALIVHDRATGELLLRVLGTVSTLHNQHTLDNRGRCTLCRPRRRWRLRRHDCHVHDAVTTYRLGERHAEHTVDAR